MQEETQRRWRWGVNRWIILGLIVLGFILARVFPPIRPHIQLPPEVVTFIGSFPLTNTIIATILADIILILIAFLSVRRFVNTGSLIPSGLYGAVESLVDLLFNLTETTAGKFARMIFPFFGAITFLVLIVNWMELVPGVDTIGKFDIHHIEEELEHGLECTFTPLLGGSVVAVGGENECASAVVPFVRVASTDLNFTIALAIISVFMTQVIGYRAQGLTYFTKFINVKTLFSKPFFGFIDFLVGIFETVSEFSKIISFSFRLFGNIFAGTVLLFVIGTLIPLAMTGVLILEFGVGLIQAIVFGMLTMVFMAQATQSHGDH